MATCTSVTHRPTTCGARRSHREEGEGGHRRIPTVGRTSNASRNTWHAGAAYLYMLHLDPASLAWEYLRRNPQYRCDWMHRSADKDGAVKWRMTAFEDPFLDARVAHPSWKTYPCDTIHLCKDPAPRGHDSNFSLWRIAGRKSLRHDGCNLILSVALALGTLQIAIASDLSEGDGYAYVVRPGAHAQRHWHRIMRCDALLQGRSPRCTATALPANRVAIAHMRSLQALDGLLAGASQREIAGALFGVSRVKRDWHADGELRAQIRYLIRRGVRIMLGAYVDLLNG
jgi:hypothetical protein